MTYSNIFVISCRRSGTHLLSDLLVNNFNYKRIDDNLDIDENLSNSKYDKLLKTISKGKNLIWTHNHSYKSFLSIHKTDLKDIFHNSKIIFIHRDIKDIITSYYHRPWQSKSIDELLQSTKEDNYTTKVYNYNENQILEDTLIEYQENWFSVILSKKLLKLDIMSISFKDIIENYENSVNIISDFLNEEIKEIKDVRLKSIEDTKKDIKYSFNGFRKGVIGDYKNLLSKEIIERIDNKYYNKVGYFLNKYFNNKDNFTNTHNIDIRDSFKKTSRNWEKLNDELSNIDDLIKDFNKNSNFKVKNLIKNRYSLFDEKEDIRYKQTIFLNHKYVLKFLLPLKIKISKENQDYLYPILSKEKAFNFIKSYPFLKDFTPKVYHIGIYNDIFYMIQDKIDDKYHIKDYKCPEKNWKFLYDSGLYKQLMCYFFTGLQNNVCLFDLTYNLENLVVKDNKLLYLDGDGYFYFDDYDIFNDVSYKITLEHINKILKINN